MAYSSWPDHGVPESSEVLQTNDLSFFQDFLFHEIYIFSNLQEFVDFVENVRSRRKGSMEPTIVHCSAGIGTTCYFLLFLQIINLFFKKNLKGELEW